MPPTPPSTPQTPAAPAAPASPPAPDPTPEPSSPDRERLIEALARLLHRDLMLRPPATRRPRT